MDSKSQKNESYIILAGGCFWGVEDLFNSFNGVTDTLVGYTGGTTNNPTYHDVKTGSTGHAEAIKVSFDSGQTNLEKILTFFFKIHNPTTLNQQGNDKGTQYRSAIFYRNEEQKKLAATIITEVELSKKFNRKITTSLELENEFYSAEEFHQNYLKKNPGGYTCHFIRD